MKELSIFVDESGDFGEYDYRAPFYIISMVIHEQDSNINSDLFCQYLGCPCKDEESCGDSDSANMAVSFEYQNPEFAQMGSLVQDVAVGDIRSSLCFLS